MVNSKHILGSMDMLYTGNVETE